MMVDRQNVDYDDCEGGRGFLIRTAILQGC